MRWILTALAVSTFVWVEFVPEPAWADLDRAKRRLEDARDDADDEKEDARDDAARKKEDARDDVEREKEDAKDDVRRDLRR